jgi:hypothetical protein
MSDAGSGLLDTSVFIARETDRQLQELPPRVAVSVISLHLEPLVGCLVGHAGEVTVEYALKH